MAEEPAAEKRRLNEQWFAGRLQIMDDVKMCDGVIQRVAQKFSSFNEQNLRKTTVKDWMELLQAEVADEEQRAKVALHLMISIRDEFQQTAPAPLLQCIMLCPSLNCCTLSRFAHRLFPIALVDSLTY